MLPLGRGRAAWGYLVGLLYYLVVLAHYRVASFRATEWEASVWLTRPITLTPDGSCLGSLRLWIRDTSICPGYKGPGLPWLASTYALEYGDQG